MARTSIFHRQTRSEAGTRRLGPLSDLIAVQLRRVDIVLTSGFALEDGLPTGCISTLGLIVGNPGLSQNDIAQLLGVDKSIVVSLMHELERRGWAVRIRAESDRRRHELHATEAGQAELDRISRHVKAFEAQMLADIAADDLIYLRDLLDRMHASCIHNLEDALANQPGVSKAQS